MPITILIAEDNRSIRETLRADLESLGYRVQEASDGLEALDRIRDSRPDLVILDMGMPRMGGYEVCYKIRQDPDLSSTPVVVLDSGPSGKGGLLGVEVGADDHLSVPYGLEQLERVVARVIHCRKEGNGCHRLTGLPTWRDVEREIARRRGLKQDFTILEGRLLPGEQNAGHDGREPSPEREYLKPAAYLVKSIVNELPDFFVGHPGGSAFFFISSPAGVRRARELIDRVFAGNGGEGSGAGEGAECAAGLKWQWRLFPTGRVARQSREA